MFKTPVDDILKMIEEADQKFVKVVNKMFGTFLSKENLIKQIKKLGVEGFMNKSGYDKIKQQHVKNFSSMMSKLPEVVKLKIMSGDVKKINTVLNYMKSDGVDKLSSLANSHFKEFESIMIKGLLDDEPTSLLIEKLNSMSMFNPNTMSTFTRANVAVELSTAYSNFTRETVKSAFANDPKQRFSYEGGLIPTSSEACIWMVENQKPEGYTSEEISAGIVAPDGTIINWNGRNPSYNCGHYWLPLEPEGFDTEKSDEPLKPTASEVNKQNVPKLPEEHTVKNNKIPVNDAVGVSSKKLKENFLSYKDSDNLKPESRQKFDSVLSSNRRRDFEAMKYLNKWLPKLEQIEAEAINAYTRDGFASVNPYLFTYGEEKAPLAIKAFTENLNSALSKLPNFEGTVERITSQTYYPNLKEGDSILFKGFASSTRDVNEEQFNAILKFVMKSKTGKLVQPFSSHFGENEVLFKTGTKFRVDKIKVLDMFDLSGKVSGQRKIVFLTEI